MIEELSEDESFPGADLAAAIASRCFYHLQEYKDALRLALSAGKYFDISIKSEYVDTLLAKCIDEYKSQRLQQEAETDPTKIIPIDPRIQNILEQMFQRCYRDFCFEQAMGIALDTRRLDKVEEILAEALKYGKESILGYTYDLCQGARNISSREFRLSVMDVLTKAYGKLAEPDYSNMCFGFQYLNRPKDAAQALFTLIQGNQQNLLMAYQISFQLLETENQGFVLAVWSALETLVTPIVSPASSSAAADADSSAMDVVDEQKVLVADLKDRVQKLKKIFTEGFDVDLILNFLFKQSRTDPSILSAIKTAIEGRSNILHNACVVSHAYMNAGTTRDNFLRDNLDWLGKASNWAKFTVVGSIGVVHKGHVHESMNLLQPYLPQAGQSSSPYSEAGALYALGLIHANKGGRGDSSTISFLVDALRNAGTNEIVQHGACLGIGLAAMATGDDGLFDAMNQTLFTDSAVAGEGAALGIGLLMVGQSESPLAQLNIPIMLNYAHDTSHEKIIRALSLSIAMMVYGKEESADVIIEQLSRDRDPIIRYGGMYAIALAYCGTADNSAIKKLLHVAVSDVNDDVRRSAVIALGFVNFRNPESVPKLVALLAESFNPHVRYGACLAVGLACAGTALKDAIDLLTPMLEDSMDYVRQGAILGMAFVLQQVSEARSPSVKKFRDYLVTVINDKHQPNMAKTGAILASGIIDAGGRNVVVNLSSRSGFMKMGGAVGMMMFLQYWYWYPLQLFLSLSFHPTVLIGLNKDFDMPNSFSVTCNAPLSMFDYPKVEEKKSDEKKAVATAVLSTTLKAKAREARKEAKKAGKTISHDASSMGGNEQPSSGLADPIPMERVPSHLSTMSYLSIEEKGGAAEEVKPAKKEREPTSFQLSNPSRLIPSQMRFINLQMDQRYAPVYRRGLPAGIIVLADNDPSAPEDVVKGKFSFWLCV
jgi:26S proteasome regulatory subunit N2